MLEFSNNMYVPSDFSIINGEGKNRRQLQQFEWVKDFLELSLVNQFATETPRNLGFYWNVTAFD